MRNFSNFEKIAIKGLVEVKINRSNVLDFISDKILIERGIEIRETQKIITIWQKKGDEIDAVTELSELISLLSYLDKNHLIFIHTNPNPFPGNFVSKNLTEKSLKLQITEFSTTPLPTSIFDFIIKFRNSFLVVGTELKDLVINDFKTTEQIFHQTELNESKRQTRLSIFSFGVAFGALIFSFIAPFVFETKINEAQIQMLKREIQSINKTMKDQKLIESKRPVINDRTRLSNLKR